MTRVSAKLLNLKLSKKLFGEFAQCVSKAHRHDTAQFLESLLSPTECIMLTKRIAVVAMLHDECSVYRIAEVLQMSTSTVDAMRKKYEEGCYTPITRTIGKSKKEREEFWKTVEIILRAGMPSRGRDRWQWLDKHFAR